MTALFSSTTVESLGLEDKLNPEIPYSEGDELITVTLDALDITGDGCIDIVQNQVNYYVADENYIVSWEVTA